MFWIFTSALLTGLALDLNSAQQVARTKFSCDGRTSGYYADVTSGCQVYHMCDGLGRQFSYTCPNATLFQQRMLICDHWYMVNCSKAEEDYSANLLIGQKKPFVEDSILNPYHRTPRPDILSHPSNDAEYNIIYRTGRDHDNTPTNIVGAETYDDSSSTDEPTYFPPSHWSTEYSSQFTTPNPVRSRNNYHQDNNQNNVFKTNYPTSKKTKAKAIDFNSPSRNENTFADAFAPTKSRNNGPRYNFPSPTEGPVKSNFRATTPVFPLTVEDSTTSPDEIGLVPPNANEGPLKSNFRATTPVFPLTVEESTESSEEIGLVPPQGGPLSSNFKATTPVFPLAVDDSTGSPDEIGLAPPQGGPLQSNFQATTPVFPLAVDDSTGSPDEIGLAPPQGGPLKSDFQATTPVFPLTVEDTTGSPDEIGLVAPQGGPLKSNFKATTPVFPLTVKASTGSPDEIGLELPVPTEGPLKSRFKATTPVFPLTVEDTTGSPDEIGLAPPIPYASAKIDNLADNGPLVNFKSNYRATTPVYPKFAEIKNPALLLAPEELGLLPPIANSDTNPAAINPEGKPLVNFKSNYKATTPVYPTIVDYQKPIFVPLQAELHVNYNSNFKATTPVYPQSVESTSPDPSEVGLLPPQSNVGFILNQENTDLSEDLGLLLGLEPPKFDVNYQRQREHFVETTPDPPSMFYQPPKYIPDYTLEESGTEDKVGIKIANLMKGFNKKQWQDLRQVFHIPDYEFPLEDATRPSYDSVFDSFEASPTQTHKR